MNGYIEPNGLSQTEGILTMVRMRGNSFAMEIVRCHQRYLAGDHEQLDSFGRSYYTTSVGTIVFCLPSEPPWFAVVALPQEL